jgi:hypothetical protein
MAASIALILAAGGHIGKVSIQSAYFLFFFTHSPLSLGRRDQICIRRLQSRRRLSLWRRSDPRQSLRDQGGRIQRGGRRGCLCGDQDQVWCRSQCRDLQWCATFSNPEDYH